MTPHAHAMQEGSRVADWRGEARRAVREFAFLITSQPGNVLTARDPSLATQVYQCQQQGSATHPYIWIKQSESLQRTLLTF